MRKALRARDELGGPLQTYLDGATGVGDDLSIAAQLLTQEGASTAAALLLDIERASYVWDFEHAIAVLEVPHWQVSRFSPEICEQIRRALDESMRYMGSDVRGVDVVRTLPEAREDWREDVERQLGFGEGATNQARLGAPPRNPLVEEGLTFRSLAELQTYKALREIQDHTPPHEGMLIAPNTAVRVAGHTWEVDFLVTCGGRCGVLDVDGPSHRGRWAADRSRDKILEDAGIAYVDRLPAETVDDPEQLHLALERFLARVRSA